MHTAQIAAELHAALTALRKVVGRIALVPTMGNLHAGHLNLVSRARELADHVVVSIFVNPLQFGVNEDFSHYPRTLQADADKLRSVGAALMYVPTIEAVYPDGYPPQTRVCLSGALAEPLEGAYRPGHLDGVVTVVNILLNQVQPDVAVFGEKDWQQLVIVRQMVRDFSLGVEIIAHPIVREADGLALSSRNQYLSVAQRAVAPNLYKSLEIIARGLRRGSRDFSTLCGEQIERLERLGFRLQYLEVRRPGLDLPSAEDAHFVILVAAFLGDTRLIDNYQVDATPVSPAAEVARPVWAR